MRRFENGGHCPPFFFELLMSHVLGRRLAEADLEAVFRSLEESPND